MSNPTELPDLLLSEDDIEEIAVDYYRPMSDLIVDVIGFGKAIERASLARRAQHAESGKEVGHFVFEGGYWVATSSDDPRGVKLYRAAQLDGSQEGSES